MTMIGVSKGGSGGGGAPVSQDLGQVFTGNKNSVMVTGIFPVGTFSPSVLGTLTPDDFIFAGEIYGETMNSIIHPLNDQRMIYEGLGVTSINKGNILLQAGSGNTSTGLFSYTMRTAIGTSIARGSKIGNDFVVTSNDIVMDSGPFILIVGTCYASDVKMLATLKILHLDGTYTTIGSDEWDYGTVSATKYRDKIFLDLSGTEYTTVDGDVIILEWTFSGNITSNSTSGHYIQFRITQNYSASSNGSYLSYAKFSV